MQTKAHGPSVLIQTIGQAARHVEVALLYADNMTDSMAKAISKRSDATIRQRYNEQHGVVPTAAGKGGNSILSFLELSRKLKQDGPDADLVEVSISR